MEHVDIGRFVLSFCFVLLLIGGAAWLALKSGLGSRFAQRQSQKARLQVIDRLMIDPRHKLMLIRCDEREHLILLGASHTVLLESTHAPANQELQQTTEASEHAA